MDSIQLELPFPPEEQWKDIPGYEGHYLVSNTGLVRSIKGGRSVGYLMKQRLNKSGYLEIHLQSPGKPKFYRIHRLVMLAFAGECPDGMQVNHKNGVRHDNRLDNLEYVTPKGNTLHSMEVLNTHYHAFGAAHGRAKLTEEVVREIRSLRNNATPVRLIADKYNLNLTTVYRIINRKMWKYLT